MNNDVQGMEKGTNGCSRLSDADLLKAFAKGHLVLLSTLAVHENGIQTLSMSYDT